MRRTLEEDGVCGTGHPACSSLAFPFHPVEVIEGHGTEHLNTCARLSTEAVLSACSLTWPIGSVLLGETQVRCNVAEHASGFNGRKGEYQDSLAAEDVLVKRVD
jgi:hypothetical protein